MDQSARPASSQVLPGDAFFLIRPTPVEAKTMRIAAMPLEAQFGGRVADEFHLTVQRAGDMRPTNWAPLLGDLHRTFQGFKPFKLEAIGLWRFYSQFRQSNALFWTMEASPPLLELRQALDELLTKYGASLYPWPPDQWKPHTLALQNVLGEFAFFPLPDDAPHPSFRVQELWLSIYQPWGSFVEHPVVIFGADEQAG